MIVAPIARGYVAGIDPGLGGALCILGQGDDGRVHIRGLHRTPTSWTQVNRKSRRIYDVRAMWTLIQENRDVALVLLEKQAPRKLDGKVATFSTGFGFGLWRMALTAADVPHRIVEPRLWRSVLNVPKLKGKAGKHAIHDVVVQCIPADTRVTLADADAIAIALAALTTPPGPNDARA